MAQEGIETVDKNRFFLWVARINSLLFLALLASSLVLVVFFFLENRGLENRNRVEVTDKNKNTEMLTDLHLGDIEKLCGTDIQYVKLTASGKSASFASDDYAYQTRNVIFFTGEDIKARWLFDANSNFIQTMDVIGSDRRECQHSRPVAIYYQVIRNDSNGDGSLDTHDRTTVALSKVDGSDYREIAPGLSSVMDHEINSQATELTLLFQKGDSVMVAKYSIETGQLLSERQISRISKK